MKKRNVCRLIDIAVAEGLHITTVRRFARMRGFPKPLEPSLYHAVEVQRWFKRRRNKG